MFHSGKYYQNNVLESEILRIKLRDLLTQQKELTNYQSPNLINPSLEDPSYTKENEKRLIEISSKINVLTKALIQMGFVVNTTNINNISITTINTQTQPPPIQVQIDTNTTPPNVNELLTPRIQSNDCNKFINILNIKYETELEAIRIRRHTRSRTRINNRIYHIDPDLTLTQIYKKIDNTPLSNNNGMGLIEHIWCNTIDEALQTYIDGDVFELAEGKHIVSGTYQIYGTLHIKGMASSNWKTLIENKWDSDHFIWCIGANTRVTFENVLIRSNGAHCGIVKLSLRAQFIGRKVLFHCNGLEGICVENESKLWLDSCVLLNSVGAGIHINTGCKCLLTQSTIVNCGEGDWQLIQGQGAIVIYGNDINYAQHLVRKTPSLRFPSMDNVPKMVLDPDPTLASMLRGRTYLYVQECKIKNNFGFGISFEISSSFNKLSVPCIASMMDVSITVRETHFNENTFGNMGKIPAHWIKHNKNKIEYCFNKIKQLNPSLFDRPLFDSLNNELISNSESIKDNDGDHQMNGNNNGQIIPLIEQALRAKNESDDMEYTSDSNNNINNNNLLLDLQSNHSENSVQSEREATTKSVSNPKQIVVEPVQSRKEFSLGSNSSSKIMKLRQNSSNCNGSLRLSAPPPPNNLLSAPPANICEVNDIKEEIVIENGNESENESEKPLRRSSRIKDKQQKELEESITSVRKQTKQQYNNNKKRNNVLLPVVKTKKQIKNKKKRRRFSRNKSKSLTNNLEDETDDKENDNVFISNINESPTKKRKINDGKEYVIENNKNKNEMVFPKRTESDSDDVEMIEQQLRRSTRKASLRATNKLTNLIKSQKRGNKRVLSQLVRSNDNKKNNRTSRRRHSTSVKR